MKNAAFFLFFLSAGAAFSQLHSENNSDLNIASSEQKAHAGMFRSVLSGAANTYDLNYHRCAWEIDPAIRYIKGAVTSYFKPAISNFNTMQFDLDTAFAVDSIKYHNTFLTYNKLAGNILQISFPGALPQNILDSVTIFYQGVPPSSGFGSFTQTEHDGAPIIWTLSEPFGAKDWWPCKQDLNDKIDSADIIITVPAVNRAASNGILLSEAAAGNNKIYHWKTRHPIASYLIGIAVTNYAVYSDYVLLPAGQLEVLNYVYPENLTAAKTETPDIINVIKFYDSLTITYPFADEKYGHAQFGWGGGMEHQTMSFVVNFSHPLIAHECAHQWFGDHVTCGSWQDIWLNEGFATYFEGLTEERFFPAGWYGWKHDKILSITSAPDGSVLCDDTTSVARIFSSRLSYNKGSYLLHMLRWKLGDSLFFLSIKNYLNDPKLAGGYAKTPDLIAHFEAASGQDLTAFFDQWYYKQGYPSYQLFWRQEGSTVNLTIDQTQSHPSVSFFEMPVPVRFIGASKDTTIIFNNTYSGQNFTAELNFSAAYIQFDPDLHILSANNTASGIPDQLPISIFPVPTSGTVSVQLQLKEKTDLSFDIYNPAGQIIDSQRQIFEPGVSVKTIDLKIFASGIYELKITGKNFNYSDKIIKK